jgi:hypothetical protein
MKYPGSSRAESGGYMVRVLHSDTTGDESKREKDLAKGTVSVSSLCFPIAHGLR